jgi:hypothetical protein
MKSDDYITIYINMAGMSTEKRQGMRDDSRNRISAGLRTLEVSNRRVVECLTPLGGEKGIRTEDHHHGGWGVVAIKSCITRLGGRK